MVELIGKKYKVVIIGESNVGKTALTLRFVNEVFGEPKSLTVGAAFLRKDIHLEDTVVTLELWDTAGSERCIVPMFYRESKAVIFVYDVSRRESFEQLGYWIKDLRENLRPGTKLVCMVVANKMDLKDKMEVSLEDGKNYADSMGFMFMKTSAKTGKNVVKMFTAIGKGLLNTSFEPDDFERKVIATQYRREISKMNRKCCNK